MTPKTSGYGLNLHRDRELLLSNAQVLDDTADTASTNSIDLVSIDHSKAKPIKVIVNITALAGTLTIKLCGSADGATPEVGDLIDTVVVGAGLLGFVEIPVPATAEVDEINLFYSAGTSGTITAWVTTVV